MEGSQSQQQAEIAADTAAVQKIGTDLATSVATIQTQLNKLQAQVTAAGVSLDFSGLESAIAAADAQAQAVASLTPVAPASEKKA